MQVNDLILFSKQLLTNWDEFGISIPMDHSKILKVADSLNLKESSIKLESISIDDMLLAHTEEYSKKIFGDDYFEAIHTCFELSHYHQGDFEKYDWKDFLNKTFIHASAAYIGSSLSLKNGFHFILGGGMHHAMSDVGRGFCLVNDIAIAIRKLQKDNKVKRAIIIDVDAHKGDGNCEIFHNDQDVVTLSFHMKEAWPIDGSIEDSRLFLKSDFEEEFNLENQHTYLEKLESSLEDALKEKYDLAFIVLGNDPYEFDELPSAQSLKLTREQMNQRDQMIFNILKNKGVPQCYTLGGGYGKRSWEPTKDFLDFALNKLMR